MPTKAHWLVDEVHLAPVSTGATRTATIPATTEAGDIILAICAWPGNGSLGSNLTSIPNGTGIPTTGTNSFTELGTVQDQAGMTTRLFTKVALATDAGVTLSAVMNSSSLGWQMTLIVLPGEVFTGVTIGAVQKTAFAGTGSAVALPSATTSAANQMLLGILCTSASTQPTTVTRNPGGTWTSYSDSFSTLANSSSILVAADLVNTSYASGTAVGPYIWATNNPVTYNSYLLLCSTRTPLATALVNYLRANPGAFTVTGAADAVTALSDASDSSYIQSPTIAVAGTAKFKGQIQWLADGTFNIGARMSTAGSGSFSAVARLFQMSASNAGTDTQLGSDVALGTVTSGTAADFFQPATAPMLAAITNRAFLEVEIELTGVS